MVSSITLPEARSDVEKLLSALGVSIKRYKGDDIKVTSPVTGSEIASLKEETQATLEGYIEHSVKAFHAWRLIPAPKRGELVRLLGDELRRCKTELGKLVTYEAGKVITEAEGEVQEMIDICDFSVGLSRQIGGLTLPSERVEHLLEECWQPLGPVGVITAFNFPVAVWSWNAAIALICGDSVLWKPSTKTPLTALACQAIFEKARARYNKEHPNAKAPEGLAQLMLSDRIGGQMLATDTRVALVSATGSCDMGKIVAPIVSKRMGRSILELGGNNAVILTKHSDLEVALPSILFGAIGTAGQRCTSTRRLFVPKSMLSEVLKKLKAAYKSVIESKRVGDPRNPHTLVGPLIDNAMVTQMQAALSAAKQQGGEVFFGETEMVYNGAPYVQPALVSINKQTQIVKDETFAPILYVMPYEGFDEAIALLNDVPQGLSAAIFTSSVTEQAIFKRDVVAGIVNVNTGTSGAEIGGAFGGEKETGGGRESGSDAWKQYMRRVTSTTYYGKTAPALAQGVRFEV